MGRRRPARNQTDDHRSREAKAVPRGGTVVLNVVICGGFSPGARVLRAAMRAIASCGNVNVITLGPSLAGLEKPADDIRALDPSITVVVDACEGGCGNQGLAKFSVFPKAVLVLPKYP